MNGIVAKRSLVAFIDHKAGHPQRVQSQSRADDNDHSEKQPGKRRRKLWGLDKSVSHSRLTELVESRLVPS
jgi:hypothetical protein